MWHVMLELTAGQRHFDTTESGKPIQHLLQSVSLLGYYVIGILFFNLVSFFNDI